MKDTGPTYDFEHYFKRMSADDITVAEAESMRDAMVKVFDQRHSMLEDLAKKEDK